MGIGGKKDMDALGNFRYLYLDRREVKNFFSLSLTCMNMNELRL